MKQSAYVRSDVGRVRENNEDNYYFCGYIREDVTMLRSAAVCETEYTPTLYAVCDGMGGESHGEAASLIAVRHLHPYEYSGVKTGADSDLQAANDEICGEIKKRGCARMGTTLAALYLDKEMAVVCNIGDSRIYLLRHGLLTQLSTDHDEAASLVRMGMLTKEQARTDKRRHALTQYLGVPPEEMTLEPAFDEVRLLPGDRFLLCSDGITDLID
ncbi:MAG: serine/threonine-protein phosphatase, partial [Lachnospiraceae bacterium]|nr:serine/threonine-protein phosphatase [Lachnospiraceae bacterium]